ESETVFAGISAIREFGALTIAAAGVISNGNVDTTRYPGLTAGTASARASHDVTSMAARLRASYRHEFGDSYITPMVDLDLIRTESDGYTEHGAGGLALRVNDSEETAFVATPSVE